MCLASKIAQRDFSKSTLRALAKRAISVVGVQMLPDMSSAMPFANADKGYVVSDNGTGRVWTFSQVLGAAK